MNRSPQLPVWLLAVPQHPFRRAWLVPAVLVAGIVIAQLAGIVIPILFLVLLTTVAAAGALGGLFSGLVSGLLMAATILYFWSQGVGPEPLTGHLLRATFGASVAVAAGSYLGLMRERISILIAELEERQHALEVMNNELANRVSERTSELQHVSEQLHDSQERLLRVTRRWIETEELERRNLARELHNDIAQGLTALHLSLETSRQAVAEVPRLQRFVDTAKELIGQMTRSVRQLSRELRPSSLDDLGLIAAVREHASSQLNGTPIEYDLRHRGDDTVIDVNTRIIAYRLIQEAIKNVIRHSGASKVRISLDIGNESLEMHVTDDGSGFDTNQANTGLQYFGIVSMRERASMMSGSCDIRSAPGRGTDVRIVLPLMTEEAVA